MRKWAQPERGRRRALEEQAAKRDRIFYFITIAVACIVAAVGSGGLLWVAVACNEVDNVGIALVPALGKSWLTLRLGSMKAKKSARMS